MRVQIAKELLEIGAVSLSVQAPYTWASGIKSPIYCDNRMLLSYPGVRDLIVDGFVTMLKARYGHIEMIMGTATAGIPWAALIADKLNLPMGYVRSSAKEHGKTNVIEGKVHEGLKVIVIEDLISTGQSVEKVVDALRMSNVEVLGVAAIFTYQMESARVAFERMGCPLLTLCDYSALTRLALDTKHIAEHEFQKLQKFREEPNNSDWMLLV